MIDGIGPVLVNYPIDTTPPPDFDTWVKAQSDAAAELAASQQAAIYSQAQIDQAAADAKTAANAKYQAGIDHLTAQLANETDPTQQYLLEIAIGGAQRLMLP